MSDAIQRAMEAVTRASEETSDWRVQRLLLAAFDALAEARRLSVREGVVFSTNEKSMRGNQPQEQR